MSAVGVSTEVQYATRAVEHDHVDGRVDDEGEAAQPGPTHKHAGKDNIEVGDGVIGGKDIARRHVSTTVALLRNEHLGQISVGAPSKRLDFRLAPTASPPLKCGTAPKGELSCECFSRADR
jgi:hypothetical protein